MSIITLISDFGTADGYVGEMKGAILCRCPDATIVDVSHEIAPGDIADAAWVLDRVWERFPEGTIHVAVVDPGVGGPRRPIAIEAGGRWYVGPDNGIPARVLDRLEADQVWLLTGDFSTGLRSQTFHGRDIFSPAAAMVAIAGDLEDFGERIPADGLAEIEISRPQRIGDAVKGQVVHVDRFGNLITDVPADCMSPSALVEVGGAVISGMRARYSSVDPGELVALISSGGTLEVAERDGSASERLGVHRGARVCIRPERD